MGRKVFSERARERTLMYTKAMQDAWKKIKKPFLFRVAIVEYPDALFVRVYENEIMEFNEGQRVKIMEYLESVRMTIASFGVQCHIEGISNV